ncbi:MAG: type IV pilus assembly protein PilM [Deltaproteobacteria bacterium]|nr:type IV pilus assembly protein PilM [Deltaproteobacteria bacterium]
MSEGKNLVGVDIGSSSIKVCEIKEKRRGARELVRFGYHPLPPQTMVDGHIMNAGAIVEGLNRLFHKMRRRDIALRISGHSVIIKKITMPVMTVSELAEQINWEAEQHIPFDLADVQIDYQILCQHESRGQMDVLLVAAKKEEIGDLINLTIEAKLRTRIVDLDTFAVQNCYEIAYGAPPQESTVVLLHIGASLTTLNILAEGTTAFTRDVLSAGNAITEEIQRRLGISQEEAEAYKCGNAQGVVTNDVQQIIQESIENLTSEIQRSLDFYLATSGERDIHKIYVSGGTTKMQALHRALSARFGVEVIPLDPLLIAQPDPNKVDPLAFEGRIPQAVVAFGLALRKDRERAGS